MVALDRPADAGAADVAAIVAVALAAGLVASVLPARAAVRTHPVAALATD